MKRQNCILLKHIFKIFLAIITLVLPITNAMEIENPEEILLSVDTNSTHQDFSTECFMEYLPITPHYFSRSMLDTLNILRLTNCDFEQKTDMNLFLQGLAKNTSITSLSLINMPEFQEQGFQYLTNALKTNITLLSLDLSKNHITGKNVDYLENLLKNNKTINYLNLSDNILLNKGAIIMSKMLLENRTLTAFNLQKNEIGMYDIGDEGMIALGEALLRNNTLKSMNLKENTVGKNGTIVLKYMLLYNNTLEQFNLNDGFILDKEQLNPPQRLQIMKDFTKYYWAENNLYAKMAVSVAAVYFFGLIACHQLCENSFCSETLSFMVSTYLGFFFCYYMENIADF